MLLLLLLLLEDEEIEEATGGKVLVKSGIRELIPINTTIFCHHNTSALHLQTAGKKGFVFHHFH